MPVERKNVTFMRMSLRFLILILAFSGLGMGAGFAGEKVWVGLYLAENAPPPPNAVLAPEKLHQGLRAVFGFKHYELMKAQEIELRNEWEQWFMPRRDFFIRVEPLRREPGEPRLIDYEIYKDGFIVAKGKYEPREGTPLFINGPDFHQGRLIFVLDAR
jgi:hypothetical protein